MRGQEKLKPKETKRVRIGRSIFRNYSTEDDYFSTLRYKQGYPYHAKPICRIVLIVMTEDLDQSFQSIL